MEKLHAKEYEKVLKVCDQMQQEETSLTAYKTISDPLKEGAHFDQTLGGIAGLFENMRANTQVSLMYLT